MPYYDWIFLHMHTLPLHLHVMSFSWFGAYFGIWYYNWTVLEGTKGDRRIVSKSNMLSGLDGTAVIYI